MSKDNPFRKIEKEGIKSFFMGARDQRVRAGINGTLDPVRFIGKVADVYLGRLMDTVMKLAGGNENTLRGHKNTSDFLPPNLPTKFTPPITNKAEEPKEPNNPK